METEVILNNPALSKTEKIRQLLALGLSRRAVADLTGGNYGFVQNVFARYWPDQVQPRARVQPAQRGTRTRRTGPVLTQGFTFIPFNRKFGVEIEAGNVRKQDLFRALLQAGMAVAVEGYGHDTRDHWKVTTDASLTGTDTFELVSPILQGTAGLAELETVCRVLREKNAYINKTCGLHIHFDAEAFGLAQCKNLLINYGRYEGVIDSFMPNSRRANSQYYCRSLGGQEVRIDQARSMTDLVGVYHDRYFKVNMKAYTRYKTIEFRQHGGTIEFEKISNWVLFLHNLTEYSRTFRVAPSAATVESLAAFQQPQILTYITNRICDLAA